MGRKTHVGFRVAAGLGGAVIFLLAVFPLAAAETGGPLEACPLPVADTAGEDAGRPAVKRLRTAATANAEHGSVDFDLEELAFVTSPWPNPDVREIVQVPGAERTRLDVTVVNNSRHASPDGGITLSFPELTRPSDRERIGRVTVPDGMALHVIPAGGELFGRNGATQVARHLMIEVQGPWGPRQARTLQIEILDTTAPAVVHYRSALSDNTGSYHNTPDRSGALDQQGWPAFVCLLGGGSANLANNRRATAQAVESGGRQ